MWVLCVDEIGHTRVDPVNCKDTDDQTPIIIPLTRVVGEKISNGTLLEAVPLPLMDHTFTGKILSSARLQETQRESGLHFPAPPSKS